MKWLIFPLLLLTAACSTSPRVEPVKTAADYFAEGEMFFESKLYDDAIASWEKVREAYYSPELTALAEYKIAEAYFVSKRYVEAAAAYEDFLKKYPRHNRAPEILFNLAMAYYRQNLSVDRDQSATHNALLTLQTLSRQFPDDPRTLEANRLIPELREKLAGHEIYVGRFYLRSGHTQAAIRRLEGALRDYPEYRGLDEAYLYLVHAYLKAGRTEDADRAFELLARQYPDSKHLQTADKLRRKNP